MLLSASFICAFCRPQRIAIQNHDAGQKKTSACDQSGIGTGKGSDEPGNGVQHVLSPH